jgi:hypothetical protein
MKPMFIALNSDRIAVLVARARQRVCFVAPGIQLPVADALCEVFQRLEAESVTVSIDLDERVMRMGYGDIAAVQKLQQAGVPLHNSPGLRTAVLIVDHEGFVYTPTALYLEREPQSDETPNAIRLSPAQICGLLIRLSPSARQEAFKHALTEEERREIETTALETGVEMVSSGALNRVRCNLEEVPPVKFDVVRQVRVFEPFLQHVELSLMGAAIQRNRVRIPKALQNIGTSKDLEGKLKTTFDLIEKGSALSSKGLEDELNEIRKDLTRSLGKDRRVVLKAAKACLVKRVQELRIKVEEHQKKIEAELQAKLDESLQQVAEYYFPLVKANPPNALIGSFPSLNEDNIRTWIKAELKAVFPQAKDLSKKITLSEHYMDFTYETLRQPDFLESVKAAYPHIDWEKPYSEFTAAGESPNAASPGKSTR